MNLEQYKLDIYRDITYKTERDSISPTTVGDAFTNLAALVEDNFVSASTLNNYYTTGQTDIKYQPVGSYAPSGDYVSASTLANYYTTGQTDAKYQPVGFYQNAGNYVSASTLGNYYTIGQSDAKYQLAGSYQSAGNYVSASTLNDYYTTGQTDAKYQPVGFYQKAGNYVSASTLSNYYTTGQTDAKYQSIGSYQTSGNYVSASTLANYYTTGQTNAKYLAYSGGTSNVDLGAYSLFSTQINVNAGANNIYGVTPYAVNFTGTTIQNIVETVNTNNRPVGNAVNYRASPLSAYTSTTDIHGRDEVSITNSNLMGNARLYTTESTARIDGTGDILGLFSTYAAIVNGSTGNVYEAVSYRSRLQNLNNGSVTKYTAFRVEPYVNTSGGTVTLAIGLGVDGAFQGYGIKADNSLNYISGLSNDNFTNNTSAQFNGTIGVGTGYITGATGRVNIYSTGTQLRVYNSQTNYADISVNAGGTLTLVPANNATTVTGSLGVSMGITQTGANYNFYVPSSFQPTSFGSPFSFGGSSVQYSRVGFYGTGTANLPNGAVYGSTIFASTPITTSTSGGHNWIANTVFKPVAITSSGANINNTATVLIDGVATGATNNYALAVLNNGTTVTSVSKEGYITSPQYKLSNLNTPPATSTSTGTLGEIRVTSDSIYVCTATNTWVKTALTTF